MHLRLAKGSLLRHRFREALVYWLWLPGLVIGSGILIDRLLAWTRRPPGSVALTGGGILLVLGLALIARANHDLTRLGLGTASPARPCRILVTTGSYSLCRHPMFLGYDLVALAVLLFIGSPAALLVSYPAMLVWQVRSLQREEHILALRFGEAYRIYRTKAPFLLPLLPPSTR